MSETGLFLILLIPGWLLLWLLTANWVGRRTSRHKLIEVGKALWIFSIPAAIVGGSASAFAEAFSHSQDLAAPAFLLVPPGVAVAGGASLLFLVVMTSGYVILGDRALRERFLWRAERDG